jgi:hypothetical protein
MMTADPSETGDTPAPLICAIGTHMSVNGDG